MWAFRRRQRTLGAANGCRRGTNGSRSATNDFRTSPNTERRRSKGRRRRRNAGWRRPDGRRLPRRGHRRRRNADGTCRKGYRGRLGTDRSDLNTRRYSPNCSQARHSTLLCGSCEISPERSGRLTLGSGTLEQKFWERAEDGRSSPPSASPLSCRVRREGAALVSPGWHELPALSLPWAGRLAAPHPSLFDLIRSGRPQRASVVLIPLPSNMTRKMSDLHRTRQRLTPSQIAARERGEMAHRRSSCGA